MPGSPGKELDFMNERIEQRIARAEISIGANCATCMYKRLREMPDDELGKLIDDEIDERLEALPYEELEARLRRIMARHADRPAAPPEGGVTT
jgi:hypothetical protein